MRSPSARPARAAMRTTGAAQKSVQTLQQRYEADQPQCLLVKLIAAPFIDATRDPHQLLAPFRPDRRDQTAAWRQLLEQSIGNGQRRGRHQDGVIRRVPAPTLKTVAVT